MSLISLPNDIIFEIAEYLRLEDVANIRRVCWQIYRNEFYEKMLAVKAEIADIKNPQKIPRRFFRKYPKCLGNFSIMRYAKFSEKFLDRYIKYVNKCGISHYQKLSENFIRDHADELNWFWISRIQVLSERFIEEFAERIDWIGVKWHRNPSDKFLKKHAEKFNRYANRIIVDKIAD